MAQETISLKNLVLEQNAIIWPNGTPENLLAEDEETGKLSGPIRQFYVDSLIDLQRLIPCLQENHTDIVPQSATYFKCGLSMFDAPRGRIRKVELVTGENFCDPITYFQRTYESLLCWSRKFMDLVEAPANTGKPQLPIGLKFPEASTDSKWGRALRGLWAIDRDKIWIAPWMDSRESVVIEWDGLKRSYSDADLVPNDDDLKRAVRLWVQKEYAKDFERDVSSMQIFLGDYNLQRSDLAVECQDERRLRETKICPAESEYLSRHQRDDDRTDDGAVPEVATIFAVIGDYGRAGGPASDVSDLVKSWTPEFIVTTGDNNYENGESATIDANIGAIYRSFIFPFLGSAPLGIGESDATENRFFPALGNHDLDNSTGLPGEPLRDYFNGIMSYYDFVWGHCHFFVMDAGMRTDGVVVEADGVDAFSQQAEWFQARFTKSTARWKIGVLHNALFTSSDVHYPGEARLRWPALKQLDLLLQGHGHGYERVKWGTLPILVNGAGGDALHTMTTAADGSQFRYNGDYGAQRVTATCKELKSEFINLAGIVIDTLTIT